MRTIPLVAILLFLSSCLSLQTQNDLRQKSAAVARLEAAVAQAELDHSPDLEKLRAELKDARIALSNAEDDAVRERVGNGAGYVETGASIAAPIAGYLFPPLLIILGLVGAAAGKVRKKFTPPTAPAKPATKTGGE